MYEMYRVALLMYQPDLRAVWAATRKPLNRAGLDVSQSGEESVVHTVNAINTLTKVYNTSEFNGEILSFKNPLCKHDQHGQQLSELKETYMNPNIFPFPMPTNVIGARVKDINPNLFVARTDKWLMEKVGEIKKFLHKYFTPSEQVFSVLEIKMVKIYCFEGSPNENWLRQNSYNVSRRVSS